MQEGADFGFVGGAYEAPMLLQDAQKLINWFVELDNDPKAKMPAALLGAPGLDPLITTMGTGPVRGAWVLPGNTTCLFVVGSAVWLASVTIPASSTSIAMFGVSQVGTLLTSAGRVVIRDNGVLFNGLGGFAVLVDGTYGYYYCIGGARTATFGGGNLILGSSQISFPQGITVPYTLIVGTGTVLTDTAGGLPPGTTISSISFTANNITLTNAATANATNDTFTLSIPVFGQITDPAFLGASRVLFIEGWLLFNQPNTRTFYTTAPIPYTLTFAGAFYALKDSSTDNLVTLFENNREAWLIGERTSEVWYNSGGTNFAFSRLPGIGPQYGCAAQHSICRVGPNLMWLGRNEQGENIVVRTQGYNVERVSTHAIDKAIASYPVVSDAIADCYEELGHVMYVLTFPTANVTWVLDQSTFDATGGRYGWWQRMSWAANGYQRHLGNCYVNFANVRMWGDYSNGTVYRQSRAVYTDNGGTLRAQRRCPHLWSRENRERIFYSSLQVEFTPGVGTQTGQGQNPQAMLQWSDDGGQSWGEILEAPIGVAGDTRNRAIWYQLGEARDRIYDVSVSDPVPRDVIGATLFGEGEYAQA